MKCPDCGYDKIQPNYIYCPKCRRALKAPSQEPSARGGEYYQTQEKGFINRAFSGWSYEKAMADPHEYAKWALRNPNDNKHFLDKWGKTLDNSGKPYDVSMLRNAIAAANRARQENPTTDRAEVDANIIDSTQRSSRRESNSTFVHEVNSNYTTNAASVVRNKAIWKLQPGELARHIAPDEWCYVSEHLEGLVIEEGTSAIIYVDGQEVAQMGSGMYVFDDKHAAAAEMEAERRRHEHQSSGGFFSRLASGIYRFFTGHKREEGSMQREERRRRVQQIISRLKKDTIIDVYLKSDRVFPAIFGQQYLSDSPEGYKPYTIQSRFLDLQVGVSMQMQISNFKLFIANYLAGRKTVTITDVVKSVDSAVFSILRYRLREVEVSERGLDEVTFNMIAEHLKSNLPNLLHGVDVVAVLDITTENEQLKRFREVEAQLYCDEQEYDFLLRTNEFRNRIASEENDQKIREAQSEQDLRVRLDEINKDKLIHDDEMEQFVSLLMNQKVIRDATNKADLDKAMLEIERNRLVSQDEFDIFTNDLENRRFDRDQVSEQLRARSLTATVFNRMELNKKIDLQEIEDLKEVRIAGLYADDEISDVEWNNHRKERGRDAEDWDLEAAVYGRKYVLDRQKLIDNAEKRRLQNEVEAEAIKGDRQGKDYIRENILKDHTLFEGIKDDEYNRKVREIEDLYRHKRREKEDRLRDMERLMELEQNTLDRVTFRDLEKRHHIAAMELQQMEQEHRQQLETLKEQNQTYLASKAIDADVEKIRVTTEGNMSADQWMSKNIGEMDAGAQVKFAESFSHLNDVKLAEANAAQTKELYEKMLHMAEENNIRMDKINTNNTDVMKGIMMQVLNSFTQMNMVQSGGQQSTVNSMLGAMQNFANTRFNDAKDMKEEYRGQMQHEQGRTDETQRQALNYTTHVKVSENAPNIVRGGTSVNVHVSSRTCPICGEPIEDNHSLCCPMCGQDL